MLICFLYLPLGQMHIFLNFTKLKFYEDFKFGVEMNGTLQHYRKCSNMGCNPEKGSSFIPWPGLSGWLKPQDSCFSLLRDIMEKY